MPQSEGAALVSHTMLAPSPDCEVLLAVQGAGLKLSPTMYKTMQDRRFRSSVMWHCVVTGAVPGTSKDCSAFVCRVMDFKKTT
jgi:hypothetical protein